jgi:hypothetical protein
MSCQNGGLCSSYGSCDCPPGYDGNDCSVFSCTSVTCGTNQRCSAPNTCSCMSGWSGTSCQTPICSPTCVSNQGMHCTEFVSMQSRVVWIFVCHHSCLFYWLCAWAAPHLACANATAAGLESTVVRYTILLLTVDIRHGEFSLPVQLQLLTRTLSRTINVAWWNPALAAIRSLNVEGKTAVLWGPRLGHFPAAASRYRIKFSAVAPLS